MHAKGCGVIGLGGLKLRCLDYVVRGGGGRVCAGRSLFEAINLVNWAFPFEWLTVFARTTLAHVWFSYVWLMMTSELPTRPSFIGSRVGVTVNYCITGLSLQL